MWPTPSTLYTKPATLCIAMGRLGHLAAWRLPGGPVGPPAMWAATSNVEEGSGMGSGSFSREEGLFSDNLSEGPRVPSYVTAHEAGLPNITCRAGLKSQCAPLHIAEIGYRFSLRSDQQSRHTTRLTDLHSRDRWDRRPCVTDTGRRMNRLCWCTSSRLDTAPETYDTRPRLQSARVTTDDCQSIHDVWVTGSSSVTIRIETSTKIRVHNN